MNTVGECDVLLVEDDSAIRESLQDLLEMEGFSVVATTNGREALNYLETGARPSLILLDLMMPVMDGFDFIKVFQADDDLREIPLCVLSAVLERSRLPEGLLHVTKPVSVDALLDLVDNYCSA